MHNIIPLLTTALLATHTLANPISPRASTLKTLDKRHATCWGDNVQGCVYGTVGSNGAAATELGTCSEVAIDILTQGGNAADGMIAGALCVGVVQAYHSGIGGGGFMLIRFNNENGTHAYEEIDFRETAPGASNETMYSSHGVNQTLSTIGGLAVGVPGEMRGWEKLHSRHGSLPWKTLFQPAIDLARNGFIVNPDLADAISQYPFIKNNTEFAAIYAPNGTALGLGDRCYRKNLADTLEKIANEGVEAFYSGNSTIAQGIVKKIASTGGIMTLEDLAGYKAIVRQPVNATYRDTRIFSTVAPSSGTVVLSALKIFEGYNGSYLESSPEYNLTTHRIIEATKLAYGQRANYGDPAYTANITALEHLYLTEPVIEAARAEIVDNTTFGNAYYTPTGYVPSAEGGTSHMAVVDGSGMAVSLTTTVNLYWGSRVMTPEGIILNNEMDDFSSPGQVNAFGFAASPINYIQPGKRPQSSIASSMAEDLETGELLIATGSAGGSRIITATLQELHHYIDQGLNASQCVHQPRWHDQLSGVTYFELPALAQGLPGFNNGTVAYLKGLGYNATYQGITGSTSHVVARLPNGQFEAASDPRKVAGHGAAF